MTTEARRTRRREGEGNHEDTKYTNSVVLIPQLATRPSPLRQSLCEPIVHRHSTLKRRTVERHAVYASAYVVELWRQAESRPRAVHASRARSRGHHRPLRSVGGHRKAAAKSRRRSRDSSGERERVEPGDTHRAAAQHVQQRVVRRPPAPGGRAQGSSTIPDSRAAVPWRPVPEIGQIGLFAGGQ